MKMRCLSQSRGPRESVFRVLAPERSLPSWELESQEKNRGWRQALRRRSLNQACETGTSSKVLGGFVSVLATHTYAMETWLWRPDPLSALPKICSDAMVMRRGQVMETYPLQSWRALETSSWWVLAT